MEILVWCDAQFPAKDSQGAERVVEAHCKGLSELGHKVYLFCKKGSYLTSCSSVQCVQEVPKNIDIIHYHGFNTNGDPCDNLGVPVVKTPHGGGMEDAAWLQCAKQNENRMIFVSNFVAQRAGCKAFVNSCLIPDEFIYKNEKEDYFLWMAGTDWGESKGLFSTIFLAKKMNIKLKIAGSGNNNQIINEIKSHCSKKIEYIGSVNGRQKAQLLSLAKGYILLSRVDDACPLTVSEALISGTPVIGSDRGALPELIDNSRTGFICSTDADVYRAIGKINTIKPIDCLVAGMAKFHYIGACQKLLRFYTNMISKGSVI